MQVISVNFHPFYRNEKQVCRKDTFYTNYTTITFQDDIFTQKTENITKVRQHGISIVHSIFVEARFTFLLPFHFLPLFLLHLSSLCLPSPSISLFPSLLSLPSFPSLSLNFSLTRQLMKYLEGTTHMVRLRRHSLLL